MIIKIVQSNGTIETISNVQSVDWNENDGVNILNDRGEEFFESYMVKNITIELK